MRDGELIGQRYRLHARLGRGGMGQVYRATDERLQRDVAVKLVDLSQTTDTTVAARFHREALATAQLNHPGIVTIFDAGTENRIAYLVMELLPGATLAEVLRADGPLSEHRAVLLARKVADALVATRAIGVVHRDIKPANIMVNGDDATLLDFGIALAQLDADMHLTAPATTLGTAAYMSPEQAMGLRATAASDVYALGGVLIAMLTGRPPYSGDNAIQVANRHLNDPVPRVRDLRPGVSGALADLIERMMAKDANARPDTAIVASGLAHLEANPEAESTRVVPASTGAPAVTPRPALTGGLTSQAAPTAVLPGPALAGAGGSARAGSAVAQATRIEPIPVSPRVDPAAGTAMPSAFAFSGEGAPAVATGDAPGLAAEGSRSIAWLGTAAKGIGVTLAAILLFTVTFLLGSSMVPSAVGTTTESFTPRLPTIAPPSSVPDALTAGATKALLEASLSGVDTALKALPNQGGDAVTTLRKQWASAASQIRSGDDAAAALATFTRKLDQAVGNGDLGALEASGLRFALSAVRVQI